MLPLYPASLAITRVVGGNVRTVPIICIIGTVGTPRGRGGGGESLFLFIVVQAGGAQSSRCRGAVVVVVVMRSFRWCVCRAVAVSCVVAVSWLCRACVVVFPHAAVIFCAGVGVVAGWRAYSPRACIVSSA